MHYFVGDLQGCCDAFERLLATLDFSPSRDHVHVLGDLVNRGPASLQVLQKLQSLGASATWLLGNHDLSLLAVAAGVRKPGRKDTLDAILTHPQRSAWLDWLVQRGRLADWSQGWLTVHAGVHPAWTVEQTLALAAEVETVLRSPARAEFLAQMFGNEPALWKPSLSDVPRWRFIVNTLTRMRFCDAQGRMEFNTKEGADQAPEGYKPWFEQARATAGQPIAFGHWSTLGLINRPDLLALDTGCVWGGQLTAVRVDGGRRDVTQVVCAQAQAPG